MNENHRRLAVPLSAHAMQSHSACGLPTCLLSWRPRIQCILTVVIVIIHRRLRAISVTIRVVRGALRWSHIAAVSVALNG